MITKSEVCLARSGTGDASLRWVLSLSLAVMAFALNYPLEVGFDRHGVFKDYNLLFDTDPVVQLESFSKGTGRYGRNLAHPNLANLVHPPVQVLAQLLISSGVSGRPVDQLRRELALLVAPLASALKAVAIFLLFDLLGLPVLQVFLATLLSVVSFSQLVFGSVPDHWALSGLAISLSFLLAADLLRREGKIRWWAWLAVGTLAMSMTITNIVIVALVFFCSLVFVTRDAATSGLQVLALAAASTALTVLIALVGMAAYGVKRHQTVEQLQGWLNRHWEESAIEKFPQIPWALTDTIAPPNPRLVENRIGLKRPARRNYQFTLSGAARTSANKTMGILLLALTAVGSVFAFRGESIQRGISIAALAVVVFNLCFHVFWGGEFFLYSQHWHVALIVLIAGVLMVPVRRRGVINVLFGAVCVAVMINNALRVELVLSVLSRFGP